MSGSFVSLKSPGTVNSVSLIGSWLTDVIVLVISVPCPDGLAPEAAGDKLLWLIAAMRQLRLTGVDLKDEQPGALSLPG